MECKWRNTLEAHGVIVGKHWVCSAYTQKIDDTYLPGYEIVAGSEITSIETVNTWSKQDVMDYLGY